MKSQHKLWAVVLAGGDGTRLASLSQDDDGHHVPKQFCSLASNMPLLVVAEQRARRVVSHERICFVVAEKHRHYWQDALSGVNPENIIVQPRGCGTANGVLLATLSIALRDPWARIVFMPADHYVRDEDILSASLQQATAILARRPNGIVMLGIEPEGVDSELGYIVPGATRDDGTLSVARFVEKPDSLLAHDLISDGAVWNSFIFAATGLTLLNTMHKRMPETVVAMTTVLHTQALLKKGGHGLSELYANLPVVDFSKDILQGSESSLTLVKAPSCGWTDLGSPKRVAGIVHQLHPTPSPTRHQRFATAFSMPDLAVQCTRLLAGV